MYTATAPSLTLTAVSLIGFLNLGSLSPLSLRVQCVSTQPWLPLLPFFLPKRRCFTCHYSICPFLSVVSSRFYELGSISESHSVVKELMNFQYLRFKRSEGITFNNGHLLHF